MTLLNKKLKKHTKKLFAYFLPFLMFLVFLGGENASFADSGGGMIISPSSGMSTIEVILTTFPNNDITFDFLILYSLTTDSSAMPVGCFEVHEIPFDLAEHGGVLPKSINDLLTGHACNLPGTYRLIVGNANENWGDCVNSPNTLEKCMASGAVSGYADYTIISPEPQKISIDIKPSVASNLINTKSQGKLPVALLASDNFDPLFEVNQSSLTFGVSGNEESLDSCNLSGKDVNGDGLSDLICYFKVELTNFAADTAEGILKGEIAGSSLIEGCDFVRILPKK